MEVAPQRDSINTQTQAVHEEDDLVSDSVLSISFLFIAAACPYVQMSCCLLLFSVKLIHFFLFSMPLNFNGR